MRFARQIIAVATLASYLALVVGGEAMHLWQCTAKSGSCCAEPRQEARSCHPHHSHGDCRPHTADHAAASPANENHEDEQPRGHGEHDAANCWVCQVLGQAQDKAVELAALTSSPLLSAVRVDVPDFFPVASRSGFHSRAPPIVQA